MAEPNYRVFLELQRRNSIGAGHENRISLLATDVTVSTSKTVFNMGVPFSGAIRGESLNVAMDMGMAQKTVSVSGFLVDQTIHKKKDEDGEETEAKLTSFELAQLIHSYADASSFQDDQNINKLVILIPSRVDHNFQYHPNVNADTDIGDLPLISWSWKNREYDNTFTSNVSGGETYFKEYSANETGETSLGISGFIRSFSTTVSGQEFPAVQFQLEFEEAMVVADNFLD
jgi:hypothetical protein